MPINKVTDAEFKVIDAAVDELRSYFSNKADELGHPLTYLIKTYGCQLNESDSEKLSGYLEEMGLAESNDDKADVVFFNTCSIRENADDRLFGNLGVYKSIKRENKDMIIAVCGCMMKVEKNVEKIKKSYPFVDLVFDPQQLHLMPLLLKKSLSSKKLAVDIDNIDYIADDNRMPIARKRKFRALVPIMYGCNNFCTFCIVPYARGRERSRDFDEIINQMKTLAKEGYKEVMLLGQNVNSYGKDLGENRSFPDLLEACAQIEGFSRIRFMTSHPKDLSDRVIDIMAKYNSIETHLHLPCQSGSDAVLKRMNRHYTREQFLRTAKLFREKVPEGAISTDIIVGFPGETDQDFEDTLSLVRECRFDSAFTFQYSKRPGTKAAEFEDQVPQDVVTERFSRLLDLQNELVFESNKNLVGKTMEILIEGESNTAPDILTGRTKCNHLVNFTIPSELGISLKPDELEGKLGMVKITAAKPYSVEGVLECLINE